MKAESTKLNNSFFGFNSFAILLCIVMIPASCAQKSVDEDIPLFEYVDSDYSQIDFTNQINESETRSIGVFDYFYNGGGVACGDFDNDGLTDIIFTGNDAQNKIYQNKGDLQFEDRSEDAGLESDTWSTGVSLVDINNDGLLDIYICNSGPYQDPSKTANQLYINKGNFKFEEQAKSYGIDDMSRSIQAAFFDMDNDGDLDLWVINHSLRSHGRSVEKWFNNRTKLSTIDLLRECNTLYENVDGTYQDISKAAGIDRPGFGLGISVKDFNQDGLLDVFVSNDYFFPDYLYINTGKKSFVDQIKQNFNHTSYYSMGTDAADINNDGHTDLVVADMTPSDHVRSKTLMASMNTTRFSVLTDYLKYIPQYMFNGLYVNHGNGKMSDIAHFANVAATDWSWAPLLADFDNDGYKDLFVTNGFYRDTRDNDWINQISNIQDSLGAQYSLSHYYAHLKKARQQPISNLMYKNVDGLIFSKTNDDWNIENPSFSNGAAYADFDNDGDLDLIINNLAQPAFLMKNNSSNNNYIQLEIQSNGNVNKYLHATVCAYAGEVKLCADNNYVRGYQSYMQPRIHLGLGQLQKIDSLVIENVIGEKLVMLSPQLNKLHQLNEPKLTTNNQQIITSTPFADVTSILLPPGISHIENVYNEYQQEVLLPHSQAKEGPCISVADINGDGHEDFFLGGAKGQASQLFTQSENGMFTKHSSNVELDAGYEDTGSLFFDFDLDGDDDLYVASGGGSDMLEGNSMLQDRLYINDGLGNYQKSNQLIPTITSSTKVIVPLDWDMDGDIDLFVGGRTSPGKYPTPPRSYFLQNDNGKYTDVTETILNSDGTLGMITDATVVDINGDQNDELVLVGEWMSITILKYDDEKFEISQEDALRNTTGWWQSIKSIDYDGDGDLDLIAGNVGLNNKFHPSAEKPLHIYSNDFDQSGTLDIVLSKDYNGELVPVRGKECSTEQMPFISDKFKSYESFANANLIDILGEENLANSIHYKATMFESILLINENGTLVIKKLPNEAQLFPINSIVIQDLNADGKDDFLLAGNIFDTEVETTPYDAGHGLILQNNSPSEFSSKINTIETGLNLFQNVRCLEKISLTSRKIPGVLVGNNDGPVQLLLYSND